MSCCSGWVLDVGTGLNCSCYLQMPAKNPTSERQVATCACSPYLVSYFQKGDCKQVARLAQEQLACASFYLGLQGRNIVMLYCGTSATSHPQGHGLMTWSSETCYWWGIGNSEVGGGSGKSNRSLVGLVRPQSLPYSLFPGPRGGASLTTHSRHEVPSYHSQNSGATRS